MSANSTPKIRRFFVLSLTIRSPFLFAGLRNEILGVDAAQLRDEEGNPIIPADQIRGVLRAACQVYAGHEEKRDKRGKLIHSELRAYAPDVLNKNDLAELFGDASTSSKRENDEAADDLEKGIEQDVPNRGCLHISDAKANLAEGDKNTLTRIEIEDETGAVKTGALQVIELAAPLGEKVTFTGTLSFDWPKEEAEKLEDALCAAFKLIPAIGAFKSAGFGEVIEIKLEHQKPDHSWTLPNVLALEEKTGRRVYAVTFDRPLLVDSERVADNVYRGSAIVPGAVFKGALAEALKRCGEDPEKGSFAEVLSHLRISHAFPVSQKEKEGKKPDVYGLNVPCSILAAKGGAIFKDMLLEEPSSENLLLAGETPAFPMDWKPNAKREKDYFYRFQEKTGLQLRDGPFLLPRVHVAIDAETLVADEGKLYSTLARSVSQHSWHMVVDTSGVDKEKQETAAQLVALLEQGLDPIGRTGAMATFERKKTEPPAPYLNRLRNINPPEAERIETVDGKDRYAITLITPAMLVNAKKVAERTNPRITKEDYAAFWQNAVGGTLIRAFTTAQMAGGYIATRRRLYGTTYYPFILTDPGSVFLIENPDLKKLNDVLRHGLTPASQTGGAAITWRNCPYVPENGYGEICCTLVDHAALKNETGA